MSTSGIGRHQRVRLNNLREAALHRTGLATRLPAGFNGRWTRRHWAHASLFATLGALVAAIVPGFDQAMAPPAVCIRFSACRQTALLGPSMTASVTSSPRRAGRQWRNQASPARAISASSTR